MKYYLRGIGIGLITATIILTIVFWQKSGSAMSDEDVIKRAKELGMVMKEDAESDVNKTISDRLDEEAEDENKPQEDEDENNSGVPDVEDKSTTEDNSTIEDNSDGENVTDTESEGDAENADDTENNNGSQTGQQQTQQEPEKVTFKVKGGDFSDSVAVRLQEAGLIDDASEFNSYLNSTGYALRLLPGTYEIPKGASREEIAKILTGN